MSRNHDQGYSDDFNGEYYEEDAEVADRTGTPEVEAAAEAAGLQHWTAPPTGQIPEAISSDEPDANLWGAVGGPSWHGEDQSWTGAELSDVFAEAETFTPAAAEQIQQPDPQRFDGNFGPEYEDEFGEVYNDVRPRTNIRPPANRFETPERPQNVNNRAGETAAPGRSVPPPERSNYSTDSAFDPTRTINLGYTTRSDGSQGLLEEAAPESQDYENPAAYSEPQQPTRQPRTPGDSGQNNPNSRQRNPKNRPQGRGKGQRRPNPKQRPAKTADAGFGRDMPSAVAVGLLLIAGAAGSLIIGPQAVLGLIALLVLLAVYELFSAMRVAGLKPATLLGLVAAAAFPVACYYRGETAFPLLTGLAVVFSVLWYLVGADSERPVLNMSLTLLGVFWVGGLASFAALILRKGPPGIELVATIVAVTVVSEVMSLIGGRAYGVTKFHNASPNKTWEGTLTGAAAAMFVAFLIGATGVFDIWDGSIVNVLAVGGAVAVLAPIGDLAQSLVKRDLGVKDMGALLPGHGGILDRIDGLLFALPGGYYVATSLVLF